MRLLVVALVALVACRSGPERGVGAAGAALEPVRGVGSDSLVLDRPELNYRVRIAFPQLSGDGLPGDVAQAVNAAVRDSVAALAADFRPEAPPAGLGPPESPVRVSGGTTRQHLSADVFSALVEVDASTGGAHGATFFLPLTFGLGTGRAVAPADLFTPGTPWADTLAAHVERGVRAALVRRLGAQAGPAAFYARGLDALRGGRVDLTVGADSVVVHVPPYQLSAYAAGSFHVGVPRTALAPFARPGGVLAPR